GRGPNLRRHDPARHRNLCRSLRNPARDDPRRAARRLLPHLPRGRALHRHRRRGPDGHRHGAARHRRLARGRGKHLLGGGGLPHRRHRVRAGVRAARRRARPSPAAAGVARAARGGQRGGRHLRLLRLAHSRAVVARRRRGRAEHAHHGHHRRSGAAAGARPFPGLDRRLLHLGLGARPGDGRVADRELRLARRVPGPASARGAGLRDGAPRAGAAGHAGPRRRPPLRRARCLPFRRLRRAGAARAVLRAALVLRGAPGRGPAGRRRGARARPPGVAGKARARPAVAARPPGGAHHPALQPLHRLRARRAGGAADLPADLPPERARPRAGRGGPAAAAAGDRRRPRRALGWALDDGHRPVLAHRRRGAVLGDRRARRGGAARGRAARVGAGLPVRRGGARHRPVLPRVADQRAGGRRAGAAGGRRGIRAIRSHLRRGARHRAAGRAAFRQFGGGRRARGGALRGGRARRRGGAAAAPAGSRADGVARRLGGRLPRRLPRRRRRDGDRRVHGVAGAAAAAV
ncbi:MAG: hypothetical protein AVDCRST_MAG04-195, partial [uncultured Acetobacteraceae bacterium]